MLNRSNRSRGRFVSVLGAVSTIVPFAILLAATDPGVTITVKDLTPKFLAFYDRAIEQARQAIAINPNYVPWAHTFLVAALALTGHDAEARQTLQRYLALPSAGPLKTIAAWKAHHESQHGDPRWVEEQERMYDGLRKAGMPEE